MPVVFKANTQPHQFFMLRMFFCVITMEVVIRDRNVSSVDKGEVEDALTFH